MTFGDLVNEYIEKFGGSPPIFGLAQDDAIRVMKDAIKDDKPAKSNDPEEFLS